MGCGVSTASSSAPSAPAAGPACTQCEASCAPEAAFCAQCGAKLVNCKGANLIQGGATVGEETPDVPGNTALHAGTPAVTPATADATIPPPASAPIPSLSPDRGPDPDPAPPANDHSDKKLTAVDVSQYVTAKAGAGHIKDMRHHALHQNEAKYHDQVMLGMRGMNLGAFSSGDRIRSKSDKVGGKLSIVVGSGDDKKFLVYWDTGSRGYTYPKDIEYVPPENDGWNSDNITKISAQMQAVVARGGLQQLLCEDGRMRQYIADVETRAAQSTDVYNEALTELTTHVEYPEYCAYAKAFGADLPMAKVTHLSAFKDRPVELYADSKATKSTFDQLLSALATTTGGVAMAGGLKTIDRACEKVLIDYKGDWSQLVDMVRGSVVYSDLQQLFCGLRFIREQDSGLVVVRLKNKLDVEGKFAACGYRDCSMNVKVGGVGHVCELQLHLQGYMDTKKHGGHAVYTQARAVGLG